MRDTYANDTAWALNAALEEHEKRTRRDRFAAAALTGLIQVDYAWAQSKPDRAGEVCAAMADAVIAALDKAQEPKRDELLVAVERAIQKKRQEWFDERGTTEPDTNASYFAKETDSAYDEGLDDALLIVREALDRQDKPGEEPK